MVWERGAGDRSAYPLGVLQRAMLGIKPLNDRLGFGKCLPRPTEETCLERGPPYSGLCKFLIKLSGDFSLPTN
jgi:hypothetical protein